ncbi:hypothetical protein D3C77_230670 [compost metagenome]
MTMEILVGADPEIFMFKGGKYHSAHGAVQGDKKNPFKVDKGAVQVDGMALEFNIDPAKNEQEFITNLKTVMQTLGEMVPGYELKAVPVAHFDQAIIDAQPEEALELGCEPDFNAWENGAVNPRPNGKVNFRTGAGHVHIGWGKDFDISDPAHLEACVMVTKQLDYYLGLGSLLYDAEGAERRVMYGAAGAFRPKSYGVEYRVLSNSWLKDEGLMSWVYRMTIKGVQDLMANKKAYVRYEGWAQRQLKGKVIRTEDIKYVLNKLGVELPPVKIA